MPKFNHLPFTIDNLPLSEAKAMVKQTAAVVRLRQGYAVAGAAQRLVVPQPTAAYNLTAGIAHYKTARGSK